MRRTFVVALTALLLVASVAAASILRSPQTDSPNITLAASTSGCYEASCNGRDPAGVCDDGITVASQAIVDGMLELRYSPSCKANWGRYTPYRQNAYSYSIIEKIVLHAHVTAWNPGEASVNSAHNDTSMLQFGSSWSQMVDGTKAACAGVELSYSGEGWTSGQTYHSNPPTGWDDKVWQSGPCY